MINRLRSIGRQRKNYVVLIFILFAAVCAIVALILALNGKKSAFTRLQQAEIPAWVEVNLIDVDGSSRRGIPLDDLNSIVVHYVANPGSTALQNRNYFNNPDSSVSSHFIVGLDGEVLQCVPLDEKSSASNERNRDTISIEVCHPDETGKFTETTYQSLVQLTAWLCDAAGLGAEDIIRHYDVTGKLCPLYYVEHEDAWLQFKADVEAQLK